MKPAFPIHPHMKKLLDGELRAGEHLVWCQQPRPIALIPGSMPLFFFGIPFFAFPALLLYHLVFSQAEKPAWSVLLLALYFLGFFAAIGAGLLLAPLLAYWKALRTVYAITNQRCIIIAAPWQRTVHTYLAGWHALDLMDLHRIEDRHGRGNLVFHKQAVSGAKGGIRYYDVGFIGIQRVRDAEEKVRKLIAETREANSEWLIPR
jgi:hypothetical protein